MLHRIMTMLFSKTCRDTAKNVTVLFAQQWALHYFLSLLSPVRFLKIGCEAEGDTDHTFFPLFFKQRIGFITGGCKYFFLVSLS